MLRRTQSRQRLLNVIWIGACQQFRSCFNAALGTYAQAIPGRDRHEREYEDDGRDGVDLRGDAAAEASPDLEWKSVVAPDQEEADGDLVHREREDQQRRTDDRELQIRHRDTPERLPVVRSEIEGRFFLCAIQLLQSRENFRSGYRDQRGSVAEDDRGQVQMLA